MHYQVVVSNIGTVYDGTDKIEAMVHYSECEELSTLGIGRFSGESVTMFADGEIFIEYHGENE